MSATLFAADGNLYATFDTGALNPVTGQLTVGIPNSLYQINPDTAVTTRVGPTTETITAITQLNGTSYAFDVLSAQLLTLNLSNAQTSFVTDVNPTAVAPWYVEGATPTPEPISSTLVGIGIAVVIVCRLRKGTQNLNRI